MGGLLYQMFTSAGLFSLGLYHLFCSTRSYLKSPHAYIAKPYYPFQPSSVSSSSSSNNNNHHSHKLEHLPLYLLLLFLLVALVHQTLISSQSDPLLKGHTPVHRFISLQFSALLLLSVLLCLSLLLSHATSLLPLPSDLFFALASVLFFLFYSLSSSAAAAQTSLLQAKCDSTSALLYAASSLISLVLACQPRLFVAEASLAGSLCLQGLWALQTGLSLYVDAFIPEGCHRLLDVVSGVEGSTQCDLEDSRLRAEAILDLIFVFHVLLAVMLLLLVYGIFAKGVGIKRLGSYEALPTNANAAAAAVADSNHIQMKTLTGTQA